MSDIAERPVEDVKAVDVPATAATTDASAPSASETPTSGGVTALPSSTQATTSKDAEVTSPAAITAEDTTTGNVNEPVTSAVLGYKAPGLMKSFKFSKRHFYFQEEPITLQHLSHYLRGEKPEIAHSTAAWATQTGKGLLFYIKAETEKKTPGGIFKLTDASDLDKHSSHEFSFKYHGQKHTFKAADDTERDAWHTALEKAMPEAKSHKSSILGSAGYKESMSHLSKPAVLAGGVAAGSTGVKAAEHKDVEHKDTKVPEVPAKEEVETPTTDAVTPRTGSGDEDDSVPKKSKSRSVSRGKRASIFGSMLGKKDEVDAKKDLKKDDKIQTEDAKALDTLESKPEVNEAVEAKSVESTAFDAQAIAARATQDSNVDSTPEVPSVEPSAATTATATETVPEASKEVPAITPKAGKRGSIFGSFFEKARSPATEKKEEEVAPAVPPKDPSRDTAVASEAPRIEEPTTETFTDAPETPIAPAVEGVEHSAAETPAVERSEAPVPGRRESFFGKLRNQARGRSPAAAEKRDTTPATTPAAVAESSEGPPVPPKDDLPVSDSKAVEASEPATEVNGTAAEVAEQPAATETTKSTGVTPKDTRRRSYFGNIGGQKKEKEVESSENGAPLTRITNLFRKSSQAVRNGKDGKRETVAVEKTEEPNVSAVSEEPAVVKDEVPAAAETKAEALTEQPASIGDVVPEAVSVGQPEENSHTVSAAA